MNYVSKPKLHRSIFIYLIASFRESLLGLYAKFLMAISFATWRRY